MSNEDQSDQGEKPVRYITISEFFERQRRFDMERGAGPNTRRTSGQRQAPGKSKTTGGKVREF